METRNGWARDENNSAYIADDGWHARKEYAPARAFQTPEEALEEDSRLPEPGMYKRQGHALSYDGGRTWTPDISGDNSFYDSPAEAEASAERIWSTLYDTVKAVEVLAEAGVPLPSVFNR